MKELLESVEEKAITKLNSLLNKVQEELISLENESLKANFLNKRKLLTHIESKRHDKNVLEKFMNETIILLSEVNQHFYLNKPLLEEKLYLYDTFLTESEYEKRISNYPKVVVYLKQLDVLFNLQDEELALCLKDRKEARKRNIDLDLKNQFVLNQITYKKKKEPIDSNLDSAVLSYLGSHYPLGNIEQKKKSYTYIGEINRAALENNCSYEVYSAEVESFLLQKELESIRAWSEGSNLNIPISKEVLLLSKQKILAILARLRKIENTKDSTSLLQTENYLANILKNITDELLEITPQTLR